MSEDYLKAEVEKWKGRAFESLRLCKQLLLLSIYAAVVMLACGIAVGHMIWGAP